MPTRYQILKSMRNVLEPQGFKLSGGTFHRATGPGLIDVIELQALRGKNAVNLGIYIPEVSAQVSSTRSIQEALTNPVPDEPECAIRVSLSRLVYGNDILFDRTDPAVGQTIQGLISSHALPWFDHLSSLPSIAFELQAGRIPGPIGWGIKAVIYKLNGDIDAAQTLLSDQRENGRDPVRVEVFASRLGIDLRPRE